MKIIFSILFVVLNPFFWYDLYHYLSEDEDDNLDLTDTPPTAGYAEVQAKECSAWENRQRKKYGGLR